MAESRNRPISFALTEAQQKALQTIAGGRKVQLAGSVVGGRLTVNFIACNAPFLACNAAFTACNAAFTTEE